jgi:hypothetical protein
MNAKEIRERLDGALSGLAGDGAPVRKLAFELHDEWKAERQKLAEKAKELESFRYHLDEMTNNFLKRLAENQSLRQKLAQRTAEVAALEGENTRLRAEPAIPVREALAALGRLVEGQLSDPAEVKARLTRLDGRRRYALAYALGLTQEDPALACVAALSDDQLGVLFHMGFSEYLFLTAVCGKPNRFEYALV